MSKEQTSLTNLTNKKIAETMLTALKTQNWELFRSIIDADISWTLPGVSIISGEVKGSDAIILRAQQIISHGVSMELKNILYGQYNFALSIHNQATKDKLILDEYLATVCTVSNEKIVKIETFVSDVDGGKCFFYRILKTIDGARLPSVKSLRSSCNMLLPSQAFGMLIANSKKNYSFLFSTWSSGNAVLPQRTARNILKNITITIPDQFVPTFKPSKEFAASVKTKNTCKLGFIALLTGN